MVLLILTIKRAIDIICIYGWSAPGAYLRSIKDYALMDEGAAAGSPHGDVRGKKTIMGGPGGEAPGRKQS